MFYVAFKDNDSKEVKTGVYEGFSKDYDTTGCDIIHLIDFVIRGKTYSERKESLYNTAIEFQYADSDVSGGLSWGEIADVQEWFSRMGKRYGMLREFHENAIC